MSLWLYSPVKLFTSKSSPNLILQNHHLQSHHLKSLLYMNRHSSLQKSIYKKERTNNFSPKFCPQNSSLPKFLSQNLSPKISPKNSSISYSQKKPLQIPLTLQKSLSSRDHPISISISISTALPLHFTSTSIPSIMTNSTQWKPATSNHVQHKCTMKIQIHTCMRQWPPKTINMMCKS